MSHVPRTDPAWSLKRLDAEIERALIGSGHEDWQHGPDVLCLMLWCDLMIERELMTTRGGQHAG